MNARGDYGSEHWLDQEPNLQRVKELRERLSTDDAQILIFLGAGLSFGAARQRGGFEHEGEYDDGRNFPGWKTLVNRMKRELLDHPVGRPSGRVPGALLPRAECPRLRGAVPQLHRRSGLLRFPSPAIGSNTKNRYTPTASTVR